MHSLMLCVQIIVLRCILRNTRTFLSILTINAHYSCIFFLYLFTQYLIFLEYPVWSIYDMMWSVRLMVTLWTEH